MPSSSSWLRTNDTSFSAKGLLDAKGINLGEYDASINGIHKDDNSSEVDEIRISLLLYPLVDDKN